MSLIFVCYRRVNSHAAGRISDRLMIHFGRNEVFRDIGSIPDGATFRDNILVAVRAANAVVAVIGDHWLSGSHDTTSNRLLDSEDFVRLELETAFRQGVPVVPVLIDDVGMPRPEDLPPVIRSLVALQFARVRDSDFESDVQRLITTIVSVQDRKRIDIPIPATGEPVTGEHLVLKHTCFRRSDLDKEYGGRRVYQFEVVLDGHKIVRERVTSVLYLLPPEWGDQSPTTVSRETPRFKLKNIAWSNVVVRARVFVQDQGMPVFLSAYVRLTETGPRADEILEFD